MDKISGRIKSVKYYRDGFAIVVLSLDKKCPMYPKIVHQIFSDDIVVKTNIDQPPFRGEKYEFTGSLSHTEKYGLQWAATAYTRPEENTASWVINYLSSEDFPGVGIKAAEKIYRKLGNAAVTLIKGDNKVLDNVGITEAQKKTIIGQINATKSDLPEFMRLGLTSRMSKKIIVKLGPSALAMFKEDPYYVSEVVEGFNFTDADRYALHHGFKEDSMIRLEAIVYHVLRHAINRTGASYVASFCLLEECRKSTKIPGTGYIDKDRYPLILDNLAEKKKIVNENDKIYLDKLYHEEVSLAKSVVSFLNNQGILFQDEKIAAAIKETEKKIGISYTENQKLAIKRAINEPISIITGGPGTGKTTIIKGFIATYVSLFPNPDMTLNTIYLAAPTGRAAKRIKEITKHPRVSTIHKLLCYQGDDVFACFDHGYLQLDVIIIDEFSMVDLSLASTLFRALHPKTKIVMVGDVDQLPAVRPGDVLRDLIDTKELTTTRLTENKRQGEESKIPDLAYAINNGVLPHDILSAKGKMKFIPLETSEITGRIVKIVKEGVKKGIDLFKDIQVLIPMYHCQNGIDEVNAALQKEINPAEKEFQATSSLKIRENDKVIQLVNRQDLGVMNGDIGQVRSLNFNEGKCTSIDVLFDTGSVNYDAEEVAENLNLAYAISIHKSQGSEFKLAVVPFCWQYRVMLKRQLIYTAVTRAKECLIMLGSLDELRQGIGKIEDKRITTLGERIKEEMGKGALNCAKALTCDMTPYDFL